MVCGNLTERDQKAAMALLGVGDGGGREVHIPQGRCSLAFHKWYNVPHQWFYSTANDLKGPQGVDIAKKALHTLIARIAQNQRFELSSLLL